MTNYVGQEKFFQWYDSITNDHDYDKNAVLAEVMTQYARARKGVFIVPAAKTRTGQEEEYEFSFENVGCCGASTFFVYF